jgi:AraC-like DNA-binding protein
MALVQIIRESSLARHLHAKPYAALVLSGGYEEAGDNGRFTVGAGDVVLHDFFEAHVNRFSAQGATVLNLPLAFNNCHPGIARVGDPDAVVRMAEKSGRAASELLLSLVKRWTPPVSDWPAQLALRLIQSPCWKLSEWGERNDLPAWTISRGFAQVFGISPEAFRACARARRALRSIQDTATPLAMIAVELGFADQAHMTRSVKQLTGRTPSAWRSGANGFKTGRRASAY